ncbi:hypothetical protein [Prosthecobacter dejongeii]|uniref:Uncharacterized protein n=1 Tax=Prosthecobacter dejongeii TaxID=48465 RepID=A0A7W7YL71_9BACT|nr:hypothetical protein [Prosthecobacter dejongeii]MBB5038273.1 hypothetical protein [Prosthecobacter dejongeii]
MKIIFETTTNTLVLSSGLDSPITRLQAIRGSGETITLELLRDGVRWQAPSEDFIFAAKPPGVYSGAALASADTWVYDVATGYYEAAITYEEAALNELLLVGASAENAAVKLQAQFAWKRPGLGDWRRSQKVELEIQNNVWRGDEDASALPSASLLRPSVRSITTDVINNNAVANTLANVTGLSFPVQAGKRYKFEFLIPYTAAATSTGSRWSINGPTNNLLAYRSTYALTAASDTVNFASAYDLPAACNATSLAAGNVAIIAGVISATADGDVIARFASEISGSAITAKAGASVTFCELP